MPGRIARSLFIGFATVLSACAAPDVLVTSRAANQIPAESAPAPPTTVPDTTEPDTDPGTTEPEEPATTAEPTTSPPETTPPEPVVSDPDAIDFGPNKPERDYDDFLLAALADVEIWLGEEFPRVYGQEFVRLEGKVYAAYPERPDDLPGCGEPRTRYEDVQLFVAFYCPIGDFIVYDDGANQNNLLFNLAEQFGPATIGIVLAHEYGHAIQNRTGVLDRRLPTILTEQQADCIAGAWAGRARRGEAAGVPFTDDDVRAGLIAMIQVEDPVGIDQFAPGGHGSGFDRVSAFQVGFQEGLARCAELIDNPLPLTPNEFAPGSLDQLNQGNAPFGYDEDELFGFLIPDINLLFDNDLDTVFPDFEQLVLVPTRSADEIECRDPVGPYDDGVTLCAETSTVYLNEREAIRLWEEIGDFSIGYLVGVIWAEAAQISNGSTVRGEERALLNDCLVGAWVRNVTPDDQTGLLPEPRDPDRNASISPGDLTEAITMAIVLGDRSSSDDVLGSAFEKIDAFRAGTLGGFDACL